MKNNIRRARIFITKIKPVHSRILNILFKLSCWCIIFSFSGTFLNAIVIYANNGNMPVFGVYDNEYGNRHIAADENTIFPILADWIEIDTTSIYLTTSPMLSQVIKTLLSPSGKHWRHIISIGDLLLFIFCPIGILATIVLTSLNFFYIYKKN